MDYATSDNTASAGTDYAAGTNTLTFNPGDTTQQVTITTVEDDVVEYDESFTITLSGIGSTFADTGSVIGDNTGIGTITNDDLYKVSISDASAEEDSTMGFTVSLHQAVLTGQTASVGYATGAFAETPNAVAGTDFTALDSSAGPTHLQFTAGEVSETLNVVILDDAADIDTEYFYVNLSAESANVALDDGTGRGTIIDNEYHVVSSVDPTYDDGSITPLGTAVIERGSPSATYTVTAAANFCISDVQRNLTSVLGGIVPVSPYNYQALDIQDDPTNIVAFFRGEINFTGNIEPTEARTYGQWRLWDTTNSEWILPVAPWVTTTDADSWLDHGDTVVIPCDQSGFDLQYKEVSGWYSPADVNYNIPPGAGTSYVATGTYISKTVQLTLSSSGGTGSETVDVDPVGTGEGGTDTHTYQLADNETVQLTANASVVVGSETIFLRWTGPVTDEFTSTTEVVMDGDQTVVAIFGTPGIDNDGDGYTTDTDCDDTDQTVHPDATELCGDGIDQDCSGGDPVCVGDDADDDGDGYTENQGDCNDTNAAINPGATEVCGNSVDEDCYDGARDCGTEVICADYAERPLETQAQSAAPNVLFVLDDSGSMD